PREARLDDRSLAIDAPVQMPCVPGDLVGAVPLEVRHVELAPQRSFGIVANCVEAQQPPRLALPPGDAVGDRALARAAVERRTGRMEQILEELPLPCVPHLR